MTGVRLRREEGAHVVDLPLFAGPDEIALGGHLAMQAASVTGGAIEIAGKAVPLGAFHSMFEERVTEQYIARCLDVFMALLKGTRDEPFVIEGVRHPYHLGPKTARRVAGLAQDGDVYTRLVEIVQAIQQMDPAKPAFEVRTPDGETARYASWDPSVETLLPPCDYVLVVESDTHRIRVPQASIEELVAGDDCVFGARFDEAQWLMGAQDEGTTIAIRERAMKLGRRLKLRI